MLEAVDLGRKKEWMVFCLGGGGGERVGVVAAAAAGFGFFEAAPGIDALALTGGRGAAPSGDGTSDSASALALAGPSAATS